MGSNNQLRLEIYIPEVSDRQLQQALRDELDRCNCGTCHVTKRPARFRSPEPAVIIAVISASVAALSAIISGICSIVKQKQSKKIVIQDRNGARLEFPLGLSYREKRELLSVLKEMDGPIISLSHSNDK